MIGLALILLPVGYVLVYTGFAGDGNPPDANGNKTYSLSNAFRNALSGSLLNPHIGGQAASVPPGVQGPVTAPTPGAPIMGQGPVNAQGKPVH